MKRQSSKSHLGFSLHRQNSKSDKEVVKKLSSKASTSSSVQRQTSSSDNDGKKKQSLKAYSSSVERQSSNGDSQRKVSQGDDKKLMRCMRRLRGSVHTIQALSLLSKAHAFSCILLFCTL